MTAPWTQPPSDPYMAFNVQPWVDRIPTKATLVAQVKPGHTLVSMDLYEKRHVVARLVERKVPLQVVAQAWGIAIGEAQALAEGTAVPDSSRDRSVTPIDLTNAIHDFMAEYDAALAEWYGVNVDTDAQRWAWQNVLDGVKESAWRTHAGQPVGKFDLEQRAARAKLVALTLYHQTHVDRRARGSRI